VGQPIHHGAYSGTSVAEVIAALSNVIVLETISAMLQNNGISERSGVWKLQRLREIKMIGFGINPAAHKLGITSQKHIPPDIILKQNHSKGGIYHGPYTF